MSCGGGDITRTRACHDGDTNNVIDPNICPGAHSMPERCNEEDCPSLYKFMDQLSLLNFIFVMLGWTNWIEDDCPVTCGGGSTSRTRTCMSGDQQLSNDACGGEGSMSVTCNDQNCPGIV